jgi:hypothetical protein
MSNPDSFIDEVNDEVRRDRLYAMLRRYGWIGILAVVLIVGGAAWSEYQKAQARAQAEALGDSMLSALNTESALSRASLLATVDARSAEARAVAQMMAAAEYVVAGDPAEAVKILDAVAVNGDIPEIYRLIASFKAVTTQGSSLTAEERRTRLEGLAQPGSPIRLLAEEQLALNQISSGNPEGAIEMLQSILVDAETTPDLQQRVLQVIVALGATPELGGLEVRSN